MGDRDWCRHHLEAGVALCVDSARSSPARNLYGYFVQPEYFLCAGSSVLPDGRWRVCNQKRSADDGCVGHCRPRSETTKTVLISELIHAKAQRRKDAENSMTFAPLRETFFNQSSSLVDGTNLSMHF